MWRRKRQTKKYREKNRPRTLLQGAFYLIGAFAFVFVVISAISLTRETPLVVPVSLSQSIRGVKSVFVSSSAEELEHLLKEKNISYLFVTTASDSAYIVTLPDNVEVVMKKDDLSSQIASLQLISRRLTMEGKRFSRLDLRFDRPVIVLK
ncbi:MAG: hypothetical protein HYV40_01460 [Candidatus Levybacteria bacterium]|nr:hypothetical protein [Candidatus Levybacteria bacterium]